MIRWLTGPRCRAPRCWRRAARLGDHIETESPFFVAAPLCAEHAAEFIRAAEEQWVDPSTLEHEPYDGTAPSGHYRDYPCVDCGHPWFTHVGPGWYDGPCVLLGCDGCRRKAGYLPGRPRARERTT